MTGFEGAEGNFHMVFLNSGEVKRVLMGSLAGPESPNPWSHKTKLRAMESGFGENVCGRRISMKKMVLPKVIVRRAIGFVDTVIRSIAVLPWWLSYQQFGEEVVKWLILHLNSFKITRVSSEMFVALTCELAQLIELSPTSNQCLRNRSNHFRYLNFFY